MSRIATVCVIVMVLIAGCAGGLGGTENGAENGGDETPSVVTYSNETGNTSLTIEVNHDTESYDMWLNGSIDTTANLTRQITAGVYCRVLSDTAYNYTDGEYSIQGNESAFTKITDSGETEEVSDLPDEIFTEYEPKTLQATLYHENGTKLNTCTVTGEDEYSHERH